MSLFSKIQFLSGGDALCHFSEFKYNHYQPERQQRAEVLVILHIRGLRIRVTTAYCNTKKAKNYFPQKNFSHRPVVLLYTPAESRIRCSWFSVQIDHYGHSFLSDTAWSHHPVTETEWAIPLKAVWLHFGNFLSWFLGRPKTSNVYSDVLAFITKTKSCTIQANQRTLSVPRNEEQNAKNNSIRNNIHEISNKFCFAYAVKLVWKGFLSLELAQISDNLMEKRLSQVIFMSCPTFKDDHAFRFLHQELPQIFVFCIP